MFICEFAAIHKSLGGHLDTCAASCSTISANVADGDVGRQNDDLLGCCVEELDFCQTTKMGVSMG